MEMSNHSMVKEFILLGFPIAPRWQILFATFLIGYLLVLAENSIIILIVWTNYNLHSPMYFFLTNLSFVEIWYVTVTLPKTMLSFVSVTKQISFMGCMTQLYFFLSLGNTEYLLLAVMAYDRYVAICKPFHYSTIMRHAVCVYLTMGSWLTGFLISGSKVYFISHLTYCGPNKINHYFCDISPLLNISCSDSSLAELVDFILALMVIMMPLCTVVTSYICIMFTLLKIPSSQGRQKAFSTCSSHLTVVILFYSTTLFTYTHPKVMYTYSANKLVSVLYTVVVPLLNPLIYCLRNKEVRFALRKTFTCTRHT
ncbi:olfactory receptor 6Y1-like [Balearica regulorum gibbericeps]|uniref:olfactory receptor 6Y1-like n=1 Tax=Balearica regulorum gibbericeps TaxID=100784 RepID=UPI003F62D232